MQWLNAKPLSDKILRQLFKSDEFADDTEAFRKEWPPNIQNVFQEFGRYATTFKRGRPMRRIQREIALFASGGLAFLMSHYIGRKHLAT